MASESPERHPFEGPVHFHPAGEDGRPGERLPAQARLLSRIGMTLVLPCQPPTAEGYVQLRPGASGPSPLVPAQVLRAEACPGGFEVELGFLREEFSAVP